MLFNVICFLSLVLFAMLLCRVVGVVGVVWWVWWVWCGGCGLVGVVIFVLFVIRVVGGVLLWVICMFVVDMLLATYS